MFLLMNYLEWYQQVTFFQTSNFSRIDLIRKSLYLYWSAQICLTAGRRRGVLLMSLLSTLPTNKHWLDSSWLRNSPHPLYLGMAGTVLGSSACMLIHFHIAIFFVFLYVRSHSSGRLELQLPSEQITGLLWCSLYDPSLTEPWKVIANGTVTIVFGKSHTNKRDEN